MDQESRLLYLLLLCAVCSFDSIIEVNGQNVIVTRIQPAGIPVEGDTVQLQCDIYNLPADRVSAWLKSTNGTDSFIAWNGISLVTTRYEVTTTTSSTHRTEILFIRNVSRHDAADYQCCSAFSDDGVSSLSGVCNSIPLSVHYFPASIYPICYPDGPFTVQEGTSLNMNCTSENGNPTTRMEILTSTMNVYPLVTTSIGDEQTTSIELMATADEQDLSFECRISSQAFPGLERSCSIGPITVISITSPASMATENPTKVGKNSTTLTAHTVRSSPDGTTQSPIEGNYTDGESMTSTTMSSLIITSQPDNMITTNGAIINKTSTPDLQISIIAGVSGGGGALLLLLILIVVCVCRFKSRGEERQKELPVSLDLCLRDADIEPYATFSDTFLTSSGLLKTGLPEMKEISPDQSVSDLGTPQSDTPKSATNIGVQALCNFTQSTYLNNIPEQKEREKSESKGNFSAQEYAMDLGTGDGHNKNLRAETLDMGDDVKNAPAYAEVQKNNRVSRRDMKQELSINRADSSTTDVPDESPPVYAEVKKSNRVSRGDNTDHGKGGDSSKLINSPRAEITEQRYINIAFSPDDDDGLSSPSVSNHW